MKRLLLVLSLTCLALLAPAQVDLRTWDPAATPRYTLDSAWAFAYGSLDGLGTFEPIDALQSWDELQANDRMLPLHGCGTYRLQLRLPETRAQLGVLMPFIWTAYRLEVNGQVVAESGTPACEPAAHTPMMLRNLVLLPPGEREVTLTVHVADHDFFFAGMVEPPVLGRYNVLLLDREFNNALNVSVMGGLLIMAIYHFLIYGYRRKETAMVYFGLICLAVMLRFAVFGDHYVYEWLNLYSGFYTFQLQVKTYYLFTLWLVFFGLQFLRALFPQDAHRAVARVYLVVAAVYTVVALALPLAWFTASLVGVQVVMGLGVGYVVYVLLRTAWLNRPDARALLLGLSLMVLAGVHDALQLVGIYFLTEEELLTFGFLCFLLVQFVVLSRRYSYAFNSVEDLSANLERKVVARTEELRLANEDIAQKNQDITDSIEYAKRIQLSILPKQDPFFQRFPESFVLYEPKDIVSGDFYWFRDEGDRFLLCAADCTGHGVPGAFMSVLGSNLLNRVSTELARPTPAQMLQRLHTGVVEALRQAEKGQSQDGMDIALCVIENRVLHYAGANRPMLLVRGTELHELQPTKHPIGGGDHPLDPGGEAIFHEHRLDLQPGDCIYLFTDGITDQFGGEHQRKYGSKRLRQRLVELHDLPMTQQQAVLHHELADWRGDLRQTDDMLLIGIRFYQ